MYKLHAAGFALAALVLAGAPLAVAAQSFPSRPVHIVVPYSAGGGPDLVVRLLAEALTQSWRQPVIVDNRPGAAGLLAGGEFRKAAPDGYTYLFGDLGTLAINPSYYRSVPYDPERDWQPVIDVAGTPWIVFTAKEGPARSMRELIELAKSNPGKLSYGSPGAGSPNWAVGELLKLHSGVELLHVPFKETSQLVASVARGEVTLVLTSTATMRAVQERVVALGVASRRRLPELPGIPTIEEAGGPAGFEASAWAMLVAPRGVPALAVNAMRAGVIGAHQRPDIRQKLAAFGISTTEGRTPEELERFVRSEAARYRRVVEASGVRGD